MKECIRCKRIYEGDLTLYFGKDSSREDKLTIYCKECTKEINKYNRIKRLKKRGVFSKPKKVSLLEGDIKRLLERDSSINKVEVACYNTTTKNKLERFFIEVLVYSSENEFPFSLRKGDERMFNQKDCDKILDEYLTACYNVYKEYKHIKITYSDLVIKK